MKGGRSRQGVGKKKERREVKNKNPAKSTRVITYVTTPITQKIYAHIWIADIR